MTYGVRLRVLGHRFDRGVDEDVGIHAADHPSNSSWISSRVQRRLSFGFELTGIRSRIIPDWIRLSRYHSIASRINSDTGRSTCRAYRLKSAYVLSDT